MLPRSETPKCAGEWCVRTVLKDFWTLSLSCSVLSSERSAPHQSKPPGLDTVKSQSYVCIAHYERWIWEFLGRPTGPREGIPRSTIVCVSKHCSIGASVRGAPVAHDV